MIQKDCFVHPAFLIYQDLLGQLNSDFDNCQITRLKESFPGVIPVPEFVRHDARLSAVQYEQFVHQNNAVPTRDGSLHDLCNALVWHRFTRTKYALNQAHIEDLSCSEVQADKDVPKHPDRSRRRDALTLIDETGVVVAASGLNLYELNKRHQWSQWFENHRESYGRRWQVWVVGHGLLEQLTNPYIGLTGKSVHLSVSPDLFHASEAEQAMEIDRKLADAIADADRFATPASLPPMPVLGVPNWHPDQSSAFYANQDYFRPKRHTRLLSGTKRP